MIRRIGLGLVFALLIPQVLSPGSGIAAEQGDSVEIRLESVAPTVLKKKSKLRLNGQITNAGDLPIENPVVRLRWSPQPLNSRSEVSQVQDGSTTRSGVVIAGSDVPLGEEIQPGQSVPFTVKVPVARLGLGTSAGVYSAFVELISGFESLGRVGTTIPWFPKGGEYAPSAIAMLWPVSQRPAVAANRLVLDPKLPGEFSDGGRLSNLLQSGSVGPVSWLVDTSALETADLLAGGYRVLTSSGPEEADDSADAKDFLSDLDKQLAGRPVTLPGYAVTDADALESVGLTSFIVRSVSLPRIIGEAQLKAAQRSHVFWAPGGRVDDATLQVLVDSGVRTVLARDRALPPSDQLNYTPTGAAMLGSGDGSVEFLLIDSQLSDELSQPLVTTTDRFNARQAILSDLAMVTLERPNEPRNVIAQPPLLWNPPQGWSEDLLRSIALAPWVNYVQLDSVNAGPLVERGPLRYGSKARKEQLPASYMKRLGGLERRLQSLAAVVDDPVGFGERFTFALQRASSSLWRQEGKPRNLLLETISHQLDAERLKLRVVSTGNVTLAGDNGVLPLTIANDLDRDVTVGVELQTENQIRLLYDPPGPVSVKSGQKTGIEVPIRVVGSQPMEVAVVLTGRDGRFYDESVTLQLQSTASSRIAAYFAGAAGLALLILVGLRLVRRNRND